METKTLLASIDLDLKSDSGEFDAILSTEDLDRDGEVVVSGALDPLPKRISIDMEHGMSVSTTVGSGVPYYDGKTLKIKGTFASTPLGQEMRTLVREGHISHMSVAMAFAKKEKRDNGVTYITKAELINAGFTALPANTFASVLSAKSFVEALTEKVGARNSTKDSQRIQGAHDLFVELGAMCSADKCAHLTADTKSLVDDIINADVVDLTESADTETPAAAGPAQAAPVADGAEVEVVRALVELALVEAELAL